MIRSRQVRRTDSLLSRPPHSAPRGAITAVTLAAALATRDTSTSSSISPQANSNVSFVDDRATDRSTYDAIADPACEPARIIQPAAMLQNRVTAPGDRVPKREARQAGEPDAHFRLKEQDRLAGKVTTTLVVINCSPGREPLTIKVLVAARRVLLRRLKEQTIYRNIPKMPAAVESRPSHPGAWRPRFRA